ncbi:MlaA family lipoprotein [Motiliproteus coralliicola]|nr:VacJ family lipoprotein [Motiliproteus coralliicola]
MKGRRLSWALVALSCLMLPFSLQAQELKEVDPWEGFNRKVFEFNEFFDRNLLLPVTEGYIAVTPEPVQTGVSNFFGNLDDFVSLVSNLLQLKMHNAAQDTSRVVANTFFGLGGLIDVATPMGIAKQDEEFGQVLGYWGVPSGPYLVLPFLGPSNVRDGIAWYPNVMIHPTSQMDQDRYYWGLVALWAVDRRAGLIETEGLISGDRYSFIRDAYLQRREFQVNDGMIDDEFGDEDDF